MRNEEESMSDDEKKFAYARAIHSNHSIHYHMHQIMERQRVVDEYRNMTMEVMDLIPLEANLYKFDLVIFSQIINMIEMDNVWHHKTFESVMSGLWNMWTEGIRELENTHMHCTNNDENNDENNHEMDGVEVIDLCSVFQSKNDVLIEGKERKARKSGQVETRCNGQNVSKIKDDKDRIYAQKQKVESAMMCWESTRNFMEEEPHKEPGKVAKKPVEKTEKIKQT